MTTVRLVTADANLALPADVTLPALSTHTSTLLAGLRHNVAGDTDTANYYFDRTQAQGVTPVRLDVLVALENTSGARQRMPAIEKMSDGNLLVAWSQINNDASTDGRGARLVYAPVTYDLTAGTMTTGTIVVLHEPAGWADGLGFAGHPALIKLPADAPTHPGRVIITYNVNDAPDGLVDNRILNIYERHSDDDGVTWSDAVKIHDAPGETTPRIAATGSSGSFIRIPSGANAGRILFPVWTAVSGPLYCVYSDDDGVTWVKGNELAWVPGSNRNEWSCAWRADGTLVASIRTEGDYNEEYATSDDDGVTWVAGGNKANWIASNCSRSCVQAALDPTDTFSKILWSGLNNANSYDRTGLVLRVSHDGGMTYQVQYSPVLSTVAAGYSDIKMIGPDLFAVAWESGFNSGCSLYVYIANMAEVYTNGVHV